MFLNDLVNFSLIFRSSSFITESNFITLSTFVFITESRSVVLFGQVIQVQLTFSQGSIFQESDSNKNQSAIKFLFFIWATGQDKISKSTRKPKDPAVRIPILAESKYSGLDAPTIKNGDY